MDSHQNWNPSINYDSDTKIYTLDGDPINGSYESEFQISYFKDGLLHSVDGPAIVYKYSSQKVYYKYELVHRIDGPAMTIGNQDYYYLDDKSYTEKEFIEATWEYLDEEQKKRYIYSGFNLGG